MVIILLIIVSLLCSIEYGRDCICDPNERRALLLGGNLGPTRERAILFLGHWLVSNEPRTRLERSILMYLRFNLVGQFAVTTGITFGLANLISTTATVKTSYVPTAGKTIGIYAALLVSHGVINSFGVSKLPSIS